MVIWCVRENETWYDVRHLDFDPSEDFHTYKLVVNGEGVETGVIYIIVYYN